MHVVRLWQRPMARASHLPDGLLPSPARAPIGMDGVPKGNARAPLAPEPLAVRLVGFSLRWPSSPAMLASDSRQANRGRRPGKPGCFPIVIRAASRAVGGSSQTSRRPRRRGGRHRVHRHDVHRHDVHLAPAPPRRPERPRARREATPRTLGNLGFAYRRDGAVRGPGRPRVGDGEGEAPGDAARCPTGA